MKTRKLIVGITLLASLLMAACNNTPKSEQNDSENKEEVKSEDGHTYEIEFQN